MATAGAIEQALYALQTTGAPDADRYLNGVRRSPGVWDAVRSVLRAPAASPAAALFATRALYTRVREDWELGLPDDAARCDVFGIALEALACAAVRRESAALWHCGRTIGFALSMVGQPEMREHMWGALVECIAEDAVLQCEVLAAAVREIDDTSTRDEARHIIVRAFCHRCALYVIPIAVEVLASHHEHRVQRRIPELRSSVLCIQAWLGYADKRQVMRVLVESICVPELASDAAETLSELVGYTGTAPTVLVAVCEGLMDVFASVAATPERTRVQHAVSEVACALSDGNADELMEQGTPESENVALHATKLLWLCLEEGGNERTFFAAAEGWASWIAAASLVELSSGSVVLDQVPSVTCVVVRRMCSLPFTLAFVRGGGAHDDSDGKICTLDLLLEAAAALGVCRYIELLHPIFAAANLDEPCNICAALFALSVAGDVASIEGDAVARAVAPVLYRVVDIFESCASKCDNKSDTKSERGSAANGVMSGGEDATLHGLHAIGQAALGSLAGFAGILVRVESEEEYKRALRCAGSGISQHGVCKPACRLLYELADSNPRRMMMYLPELIPSVTAAAANMPMDVAELCVRALSRCASGLPSYAQREQALTLILAGPCQRLGSAMDYGASRLNADRLRAVARDVGMVNAAVHELNDNEAATRMFGRVQRSVFAVAMDQSDNAAVAGTVCKLFEVCVLPTLLDDDGDGGGGTVDGQKNRNGEGGGSDDRKERIVETQMQAGLQERLGLALSCMALSVECFERSGHSGETCWMESIASISPHIVGFLEGPVGTEAYAAAITCLSTSLAKCIHAVTRFTDGNWASRAEMTCALLSFTTSMLPTQPHPVTEHAAHLAPLLTNSLRTSHTAILRTSLKLWKALLHAPPPPCTPHLLTHAHGPIPIISALLAATTAGGRAGRSAADVAAALAGHDARTLRLWLAHALAQPDVPVRGVSPAAQGRLRDMVAATDESCRALRRVMWEVGRVCAG